MKIKGRLEIFGPNGKPWRVADEPYLIEAIKLAKTDAAASLELAKRLTKENGISGIVRFRCSARVGLEGCYMPVSITQKDLTVLTNHGNNLISGG